MSANKRPDRPGDDYWRRVPHRNEFRLKRAMGLYKAGYETGKNEWRGLLLAGLILGIVFTLGGEGGPVTLVALLVAITCGYLLFRDVQGGSRGPQEDIRNPYMRTGAPASIADSDDPFEELMLKFHLAPLATGGGDHDHGTPFLGFRRGDMAFQTAPKHSHVLVLGPSQSGKTTHMIIPTLNLWGGPAVVTSTKTDVLEVSRWPRQIKTPATAAGALWAFDPSGEALGDLPSDVHQLHWSPLQRVNSWGAAQRIAQNMVGAQNPKAASGRGGEAAERFFMERAKMLLAALLYAASIDPQRRGHDIEPVLSWLQMRDWARPAEILEHALDTHPDALSASRSLVQHEATGPDEQASTTNTATIALSAYNNHNALVQTRNTNFDVDAFVRSKDTVYIVADADYQEQVAPVIVGFLDHLRAAAFDANRRGQDKPSWPTLFLLDEMANIAPIPFIGRMLSEGLAQGVLVVGCLQDLSQARERWGADHGFLTHFQTLLIFNGIRDRQTVETISMLLGEEEVRDLTETHPGSRERKAGQEYTRTYSTRRRRVLAPEEIASFPPGFVLAVGSPEHFHGGGFHYLVKTRWSPGPGAWEPWSTVNRFLAAKTESTRPNPQPLQDHTVRSSRAPKDDTPPEDAPEHIKARFYAGRFSSTGDPHDAPYDMRQEWVEAERRHARKTAFAESSTEDPFDAPTVVVLRWVKFEENTLAFGTDFIERHGRVLETMLNHPKVSAQPGAVETIRAWRSEAQHLAELYFSADEQRRAARQAAVDASGSKASVIEAPPGVRRRWLSAHDLARQALEHCLTRLGEIEEEAFQRWGRLLNDD